MPNPNRRAQSVAERLERWSTPFIGLVVIVLLVVVTFGFYVQAKGIDGTISHIKETIHALPTVTKALTPEHSH